MNTWGCFFHYLKIPMGQPTDPKSYRNCLKFCTLAPWVNTWGCFFHFLKNFIFGAHGTRWAQKVPKTLGQPRDLKRNRIFLYACFLSENLGDFFHFHYLKIFILGAHGTCLAQKGLLYSPIQCTTKVKPGFLVIVFGVHELKRPPVVYTIFELET